MQIRFLIIALFIGFSACFLSCNTTTPEKYFDISVLNSNTLLGFAEQGPFREFETPSAKMDEKGKVAPEKRADHLTVKIQIIEAALAKIESLTETEETKDMLRTSKALHEYVLPVYKNEYVQLAKLYDDGAAKDKIASQTQLIHDKYYSGFKDLYLKLVSIGKAYAAKHSINVRWGNEPM